MPLSKIVTFCRGDAAARAVIGPLTKTRPRTINVDDYIDATAGSLSCVNLGPYRRTHGEGPCGPQKGLVKGTM